MKGNPGVEYYPPVRQGKADGKGKGKGKVNAGTNGEASFQPLTQTTTGGKSSPESSRWAPAPITGTSTSTLAARSTTAAPSSSRTVTSTTAAPSSSPEGSSNRRYRCQRHHHRSQEDLRRRSATGRRDRLVPAGHGGASKPRLQTLVHEGLVSATRPQALGGCLSLHALYTPWSSHPHHRRVPRVQVYLLRSIRSPSLGMPPSDSAKGGCPRGRILHLRRSIPIRQLSILQSISTLRWETILRESLGKGGPRQLLLPSRCWVQDPSKDLGSSTTSSKEWKSRSRLRRLQSSFNCRRYQWISGFWLGTRRNPHQQLLKHHSEHIESDIIDPDNVDPDINHVFETTDSDINHVSDTKSESIHSKLCHIQCTIFVDANSEHAGRSISAPEIAALKAQNAQTAELLDQSQMLAMRRMHAEAAARMAKEVEVSNATFKTILVTECLFRQISLPCEHDM